MNDRIREIAEASGADPNRVLARLTAIERRLAAIEARHRDDECVVAEIARELTAMATIEPGSAHGGATVSNDGGGQ